MPEYGETLADGEVPTSEMGGSMERLIALGSKAGSRVTSKSINPVEFITPAKVLGSSEADCAALAASAAAVSLSAAGGNTTTPEI
jgi:hypothetical protein